MIVPNELDDIIGGSNIKYRFKWESRGWGLKKKVRDRSTGEIFRSERSEGNLWERPLGRY